MPEKKNVLVVDNNEKNRLVFDSYLGMQGFTVCFIKNDYPALQQIREKMPDIILLNIIVPEPDEFRILEDLRNDPDLFEIPVMVLTVKSTPKDMVADLRTTADDFMIKPFDVNEFISKIKQLAQLNRNQEIVRLKTTKMTTRLTPFKINFNLQAKETAFMG